MGYQRLSFLGVQIIVQVKWTKSWTNGEASLVACLKSSDSSFRRLGLDVFV